MGYRVVQAADHEWDERPNVGGQAPRLTTDVTTTAGLQESRARLWRLPAHTRGRRHKDLGQEELFLVIEGTLTVLLGEPPERFDVGPQGVVAVEIGTALQLRNESDSDVLLFAYGAPAVTGQGEMLDDVEL